MFGLELLRYEDYIHFLLAGMWRVLNGCNFKSAPLMPLSRGLTGFYIGYLDLLYKNKCKQYLAQCLVYIITIPIRCTIYGRNDHLRNRPPASEDSPLPYPHPSDPSAKLLYQFEVFHGKRLKRVLTVLALGSVSQSLFPWLLLMRGAGESLEGSRKGEARLILPFCSISSSFSDCTWVSFITLAHARQVYWDFTFFQVTLAPGLW